MKGKYKCAIITQGINQPADLFADSISVAVNKLSKRKDVIDLYPVQLTSAGNGRKEAFIQWTESTNGKNR